MRRMAIKEQVKRIKESAAKEVKAELKEITMTLKEAGKAARENLAKDAEDALVGSNETAKKAIQDLGQTVLEEDKAMFETAKEHETKLAKEVIKLVWEEGLQSSYDSTMELSGEAAVKAQNTSKDEILPAWIQSLKEA